MVGDADRHNAIELTNGPVNMLARDYINETDDSIINNEDTYDQWPSAQLRSPGNQCERISCHDGRGYLEKVNQWLSKKRQAFGSSRILRPVLRPFGDYTLALTDDGKGTISRESVTRMQRYPADVSPAFLLTDEKPEPRENPRAAYARMLTGNIQFARATVNLIWAELMGVGIVDPVAFDLMRRSPIPNCWTRWLRISRSSRDLATHGRLQTRPSAFAFRRGGKPDYARYFACHFPAAFAGNTKSGDLPEHRRIYGGADPEE
jgi:hypothetical protein